MTTLLLDCSQGARKGQLVDTLYAMVDTAQRADFAERMQAVAIDGLAVDANGDHLEILVDGRTESQARHDHAHAHEHGGHHAHEHRSMADVRAIVEASSLPNEVVADVMGVYDVLAQAEAKAHDASVQDVHFHEVGNDFAIASIIAFCVLMDELAPAWVTATPIATGFGFVDCAHGRLPIPAPATANILEGMPHYAGDVEGELCTPTGAAIVKHFANAFVEELEDEA